MLPEVPGVLEVLGVREALEVSEAQEVSEVGGLVVEEVSVVGMVIDFLMTHH